MASMGGDLVEAYVMRKLYKEKQRMEAKSSKERKPIKRFFGLLKSKKIAPTGRTTTCIVITPPGTSPTSTLDSARVRLFSNILPALISFRSFMVFGAISLSISKKNLETAFIAPFLYLLEKRRTMASSKEDTITKLPPCGHRANMISLRDATVVEGSYLLGPISVPSKSLNFTSIESSPAILRSIPDEPKPLLKYPPFKTNQLSS
ncbi:hypothetical protein ACMD2_00152 [Ananas comosus]|uniref:Uncharacterized protein n=1 Tax=Ananas comosus TaxID=4615 RepID=A0A199VQB1_ANACO|nr:hypothetical protein ACMD2_00152 [Ananas comosus]